MSTDRSRFFRFRAFWLTAGLTTAAASWTLAVEPTSPPQFLQPVPRSPVVQTQAETPAPNPAPQLRTQMSGGAAPAYQPRPMGSSGPKSEVQKQLEALYEQNGRPVLELPDSGIQRQAQQPSAQGAPVQASPAANAPAPSAAPHGMLPVQTVGQSRPVTQPSGGPVSMDPDAPQPKTWAEAQSMGVSTAKPKKPVGWLEQINPFRKPAPKAPPEEPSEIHYDPRRTAAQAGVYGVQAPPPLAPAAIPPAAPPASPPAMAARPASRLPNYGQLFGMPQAFAPQTAAAPAPAAAPAAPFVPAVPAPQGDPFVGVPNTVSGSASAPAALPYLDGFGKPVPAHAAPAAAPMGHPLANNTTAAPSALPVLDFSKPIPLAPEQAAAPVAAVPPQAPVAAAPSAFPALPPAQVAALPAPAATPQPFAPQAPPATSAATQPPAVTLAAPTPLAPPATDAPQAFVPQFAAPAAPATAAPTPPAAPAIAAPAPVPFTGLGLNDPVPMTTTSAAPVIITPSVEVPLPSAVPAPAPAAVPLAAPANDGFVLPVPLPAPNAGGPGPRTTTSDAPRPAVPPAAATVPPALVFGTPAAPAAEAPMPDAPVTATPVPAAPLAPPPLAPPPLAAADHLPTVPPVVVPPLAPAAPAMPPAQTSAAPVVTVPAVPPAAPAAAPSVAAPALPAVPAAPLAKAAEEGFFSDEDERSTDQPGSPAPAGLKPGSPLAAQSLPATPPIAPSAPMQPAAPPVQAAASPLPPLNVPPVAAADPVTTPATVQPAGQPSLQPVPRTGGPAQGGKMALIAARVDRPGLKGFCPVMLRDHRELVDARPEFQSSYGRRVIMLSSAEAKIVFDSDPAKYAPAADGNDVVHFKRTGEELEGSLQHAVWYKGRLYLFVSGESLDSFIGDPLPHAVVD
ncbi:hypothetical protein [Planctomyces sp. SH-PL14]|uniref:hypothetical protein n=1 Tax=Planctomyces sp. SH-PL14 TaxID=1632864 RepID=UPI00078B9B98|nr:hypothetical protein [Planctomyces sp. SH-PL14]AMV17801.1 hypothetical protein VT03_07905 [Planctomyces sp. SH-PL14]